MAIETAAEIPVIDISSSNTHAARQILEAASAWGFVYVENDGNDISRDDLRQMFHASIALFASPTSEKETCSISQTGSGKNRGWSGLNGETLNPAEQKRGDFKEVFNIGEYASNKPQQPFPPSLQPHTELVGRFSNGCHQLCNRILSLFAQALDIPEDWFFQRHDRIKGPSGTIFRMLYYPTVPSDVPLDNDKDIRAGAHSDYGSITLLFQMPGQPGLEVLSPNNEWAPVRIPIHPNANEVSNGTSDANPDPASLPILVNIGDLLAYWTNGLLKSTVHRVTFPAVAMSDRYSIVYFCHPLDDAKLEAVPSKLVKDRKGKFKGQVGMGGGAADGNAVTLTAGEYLERRLKATYGGS